MRYATARAFRMALEQRLKTESARSGVRLPRLRKLVVFDRLLARLLIAAPDRWLLKGALALDYRIGAEYRTTRDLDLTRQDNESSATDDLLSAQELDLGDYFGFEIGQASAVGPGIDAVRYSLTVQLAGYRFENVGLDISFSDPRFASPEILQGPGLLQFADIDPISVPAIPIEQHIAEKVHAYTRVYQGRRSSSRAKDLVDLVAIQSSIRLEAGRLRDALELTFAARASQTLPVELPPPPDDWASSYATLAREVELDLSPREGHRIAANFLDPILATWIPDGAIWNPRAESWE